jgi:transmembrane sensor
MNHDDERPLADDITARVDDARLARQWRAVSKSLVVRPRRSYYFAALAPAALVAVAFILVLAWRPWRSAGGAVATARASDALVLADGSRVTLSSGAELTIDSATRERVHLVLSAGSIALDVTHVEGRPFVVSAAGHDVTVLGTAFAVKLDSHDATRTLAVDVTRGRVAVTGPTGEHLLEAGQSWSTRVETASATSTSTVVAAASSIAIATDEPSARPESDTVEAPPLPSSEPSSKTVAAATVEGPRELLARATEARTSGRPRDAALALDTLRKRYRSDSRAGLAAFELGRVRMDALSDPAGAAEAFADAIALAPGAPFREDAEARRVEALDALPDRGRCERVRDAYLARYPTGLHARQVATRCKRP